MKRIILLLIVLVSIGNVLAADRVLYWRNPSAPGGTDPGQWNDPDNWWQIPGGGTAAPGPDDHLIIHSWGPMPVINSNEYIVGIVTPAWHSGVTAEMKMTHGGFMYVRELMRLGCDGEKTGSSLGILYIEGGMLIAQNMQIGTNVDGSHGSGRVYLTDGTLYCESLTFAEDSGSGSGTGNIDITEGALTITGDVTSQVAAWIAGGQITSYGGLGGVEYTYNTDTERTDVMADPGNFYWQGTDSTDWSDEDNWGFQGVPGIGHDVVIDDNGYFPILDSIIPGVQTVTVASQPASTSYLTMQAGSGINVGTTTLGKVTGSDGTLIMDGGHLNTTTLRVGYYGNGQVDLNSGIIHTWNLTFGPGSNIDISEGSLIIHGDKTAGIPVVINNGRITAYSGNGRIVYDYDKTRSGKTTITAAKNMLVAYGPTPGDNNKILADSNAVLSWSAGTTANHHDVYLGTDFDDVNSADISDLTGIYRGRFDSNNCDPCGLGFKTTYYWRIDEVDGASIHKGDIWKLTTRDCPDIYQGGKRKYQIWGGPDCMHNNNELFVEDASWPTAKHAIQTFKLHSRALDNNDLERGWILDVPQMVSTLNAAHLGLAVDFSAAQGYLGGNSGLGTGIIERLLMDPIYDAGGKIDYITVDAIFSRILEGGNKDSCWFGRSIEETMANLVTYFLYIHEKYPDIKISCITNFPWWDFEGLTGYFGSYSWTTRSGYEYNELLDALIAALEAAGESLYSVHADNPYNYYLTTESPYTPDPINDPARLLALEAYCRRNNLKFGFIHNSEARETQSDQEFYEETLMVLYLHNAVGGRPDFMEVQTWYAWPDQYMPDTELYSFMRLINDFTIAAESIYPRYKADIDHDGSLDLADMELMSENWLKTGLIIKGDINSDGSVDMIDLAELAQDWLEF